jgi:hypothetical protein
MSVMTTLVLDIIVQNFFDNFSFDEFYDSVCLLRLGCIEFKNIIDHNALFQRKKSAYMLKSCFQIMSQGINVSDIEYIIEYKLDYKYMLNCIYNIGSNGKYMLSENKLNYYKKGFLDYSNDKFNPFRRLRIFKYFEFKERTRASIMLSLALGHAEKPCYFKKTKAIDDYYLPQEPQCLFP